MKNLFLIAAMLLAFSAASAQGNVPKEVNYYGVDFSKTKVFGANESGDKFKDAFIKINTLVISEWSKFNPGKLLKKKILVKDISPTMVANNAIDPSTIAATTMKYSIANSDIAKMVKSYQIDEKSGTGLVILGEFMNKTTGSGSFIVVYFDIASREILFTRQASGRAGGFGLRNYWSGALYDAVKRAKTK